MMLKRHTQILSEELFNISLTSYLLLLLVETMQEGFISYFFDLNWLLAAVLVSGIATSMLGPAERTWIESLHDRKHKKNWLYILLVSAVSGILVYFKIQDDLGRLAIVIAGLCGAIVLLLSYLILKENDPGGLDSRDISSSAGKHTPLPTDLLRDLHIKR